MSPQPLSCCWRAVAVVTCVCVLRRYKRFAINAFVDKNPLVKWCPKEGCGQAVARRRTAGDNLRVQCGKGHAFWCVSWWCLLLLLRQRGFVRRALATCVPGRGPCRDYLCVTRHCCVCQLALRWGAARALRLQRMAAVAAQSDRVASTRQCVLRRGGGGWLCALVVLDAMIFVVAL